MNGLIFVCWCSLAGLMQEIAFRLAGNTNKGVNRVNKKVPHFESAGWRTIAGLLIFFDNQLPVAITWLQEAPNAER